VLVAFLVTRSVSLQEIVLDGLLTGFDQHGGDRVKLRTRESGPCNADVYAGHDLGHVCN